MLDLKQIESFYPEHLRVFKRNIIREYLQYKILEIIFSSDYAGLFTFIGGTALRIILQHSRFSEDLDFDIDGTIRREDIMEISELIDRRLRREGYAPEIKQTFKGAYRICIGFRDILFKEGLSGHRAEKLTIHVDAEPQGVLYKKEKPLINRFDVFLRINAAPSDVLLSQKLYAILKRKRPMGRDFYDVIFLFGKTNPNLEYLKKKAGISSMQNLKKELALKCKDLNFKQLSTDIKPYLFNPEDERKILIFPDYIRTL